ncbi:MAG: MmgE/PrpD family protein [Phycisphaerales bacterium]|nr:MmgE/PrpD family protein [Phycisphaerales bacterium]
MPTRPLASEPSTTHYTTLRRDSNQALGIAQFAIDFIGGTIGDPDASVLKRTELFHTDSVFTGISAIALGCNAPNILRNEAVEDYPCSDGSKAAYCFGSDVPVVAEKAIVANSSAVREWDSNGTNFGFNPGLGHTAGEFGHNDFYPVVVAACQQKGLDGRTALRAMLCLDEIRGRLAEVFSLKSYKIDHVVHGAIGSAAVYGALMGATAAQIESAIGMVVAHYIPWRAIRAGKQLSDSKGASAAISSEAAIMSVKRSMRGFLGPRDIFRNPEAIFRFFEPTTSGDKRWTELADAPFDLVLAHSGTDFAIMGMHFKLGLYEHQSAGAIQGAIDLIAANPGLVDNEMEAVSSIKIVAYEPAYGIIGNPAKMDPKTRQSADHSMAYIIATLLRKAIELKASKGSLPTGGGGHDELWKAVMLNAWDYKEDASALFHPLTRRLMSKIRFEHGGPAYDEKYPDGIPTSMVITDEGGTEFDSGFVMYPAGHARNTTANLADILDHKFRLFSSFAVEDRDAAVKQVSGLAEKSAAAMKSLYQFPIRMTGGFE